MGMGWAWHPLDVFCSVDAEIFLGRQVGLHTSGDEEGFDTPPTEHADGFPRSALCVLHILVSPLKYKDFLLGRNPGVTNVILATLKNET